MLEQPLHRPDQRVADPLDDPGMAQGEGGGRHPCDDHDCGGGGEDTEADPAGVVAPGVNVVEVAQQPGSEHQGDVDDDEEQEPVVFVEGVGAVADGTACTSFGPATW